MSTSISLSVRFVTDVLKHSLVGKYDNEIDATAIENVFSTYISPRSFLNRRGESLSLSYCSKIIMASVRLVEMLRNPRTPKLWLVEASVSRANATESILKNLWHKYRKMGKKMKEVN